MRRLLCRWVGIFSVAIASGPGHAFSGLDVGKTQTSAVSGPDADFFESKVRPLLTTHCLSCHGQSKQKGGLRLDSLSALLKGGENGAAVVPGHPEKSPLVEAIGYEGDTQMPPKGSLKKSEIATLTEWVKRGAPWPVSKSNTEGVAATESFADRIEKGREFWSFQPVTDPAAPKVKHVEWPQGKIDRFVLSTLEAKGLSPSRPADKRVLIRRASFDVIGLPPTVEEVDAFLADTSASAFEKVVDRLLASPRHGERWGRHWLDLARYGEDQAHDFQPRLYPQGYRYRDWVANAFNRDLPYDRFLLEQIAGDLLDEPGKLDRLPALGFFALGPVYYGDAKKHDQVDDRIDTLMRGVEGLTVACARCHDHKYDPIPTTDYYALAGVFHSTAYQEAPLAPPSVVEAYDKAMAAIGSLDKDINDFLTRNAEAVARSRVNEASKYVLASWKLIARRADQKGLKTSEVAREEGVDSQQLDKWVKYLTDESMMKSRPGLTAWKSLMAGQKPTGKLVDDPAVVAEARKAAEAVQAALRDVTNRKIATELTGIATSKPMIEGGVELAINATSALEKHLEANLLVVKPLTDRDKDFYRDFLGNEGLLVVPKGRMESVLDEAGRQKLKAMKTKLAKAKDTAPEKYPATHTLKDDAAPANMQVLIRGNAATPGEKVPRRFLTILGGDRSTFQTGSGRLELARAITDRANPLTARVFVNRVWQHYFGRGLVPTVSNFGVLGERPSHPELLDHLASTFMKQGWSIKALHRSILLSSTYQQACDDNSQAMEVDPANALLWRMTRKRLEVEPWRDAMLAVSGQLDTKLGGASVSLDLNENTRRTYYAKISRHNLAPLLRLFDFPDPNITSGERTRTTVALQQLLVLNDEMLIRSARGLVDRLKSSEKTTEGKIERAYRILFARVPSEREKTIAMSYLSGKDGNTPTGASDLTRWERYAQALLASNEFLFVD